MLFKKKLKIKIKQEQRIKQKTQQLLTFKYG